MAKGTLYANVPLSNKYKDIPRFKSDANVTTFLKQYSTHEYSLSNDFNIAPFGQGDELITSLIIDTSTFDLPKETITGFNYLKVTFTQGECFVPFIYYFITDIDWLGGRNTTTNNFGKVLLHLEVDVTTTFKLCYQVRTDEEVFTERRHCSRFVKVGDKYMFNDTEVLTGDPLDSQFQADIPDKPVYYKQLRTSGDESFYNLLDSFEWVITICRDEISTNQSYIPFMKSKTKVSADDTILIDPFADIQPTNENSEMQISNNGRITRSGVYVYISPLYNESITSKVPYTNDIYDNMLFVKYNVEGVNYVCPILEPDNEIYGSIILARFKLPLNLLYQLVPLGFLTTTEVSVPNFNEETGMISKNLTTISESGILYNNYISPYSFIGCQDNDTTKYEGGRTYRYKATNIYHNFRDMGIGCYMCLNVIDYNNDNFTFTSEEQVVPLFNSIPSVDNVKSLQDEPKLFIEPYAIHTIKSKLGTPSGFNFNPLLLETERMGVIFKYVPNVSTAKFSMFITPQSSYTSIGQASYNSPYYNLYSLNVGDINISDYTLPIKSNQFYEMALNQRNYRTTGLAVPVASSLTQSVGLIGATALFNPKAMLSSVAGASVGVSSAISAMGNYFAHIDNLKNAPDSVRNSGNDALHDACLGQELRPYLSVYRLKLAQQKQVFDYYYRYGYMVNTYETMGNWFTRQIFNYIKTNDDDLENKFKSRVGSLMYPQFIRKALADILNNGVTFWEMEQIDKFMNRSYENAEYADKVPER